MEDTTACMAGELQRHGTEPPGYGFWSQEHDGGADDRLPCSGAAALERSRMSLSLYLYSR